MENNKINLSFTKTENICRKAWLITLMLYPIITTLSFLGITFSSIFGHENIFQTEDISFFGLLLILLVFWGLFYMNYRSSYKKTGTKLLTYRLIVSIPTFVGSFLFVIYRLHIITIVAFAIFSWVILINIVMFKINLKYKKNQKQKTLISG